VNRGERFALPGAVVGQRRPDEAVSSPGDIRIGDAEFDARYVVKSNDEKFAREFLDGAARQAVEDLRNLLGNDRILVSLNSSRLMVRKESVIATSDDLSVFADLAGRLHDRIELLWQRASGIEIIDAMRHLRARGFVVGTVGNASVRTAAGLLITPSRRDYDTMRAADLTKQMLAFSRRQVLQPKVIDLNIALRKVEPMLRRVIGEARDVAAAVGDPFGCAARRRCEADRRSAHGSGGQGRRAARDRYFG
jgi:hypothetical protein